MTPTTAQAIIDHVKRLNVPAKPSVSEAEGVLRTWLRAIGWKQDNWGNFLDPSDPTVRYHFKKTVLDKQWRNDRGVWSNLSYTQTIDSAVSLIVSAAGVVGDQELVAKYSRTKGKRVEQKKARADSAKDRRDRAQAFKLALREYATLRRGFVEKYMLGKASNEEVIKAREEMTPLHAKWLSLVQAGKEPADDQQFASVGMPPLAGVLGRQEDGPYVWFETVDGVRYSIAVKPVGSKTAEISIGDSGAMSLGVSAVTRWISTDMDVDAEGDAYISGKVWHQNGKYNGALYLIMATAKQKGAGTRVLSLWCRLMAGYGIKIWVAEAVGEEGAAFMRALEKKGKLKILVQQGPNWAVQCEQAAQNPSLKTSPKTDLDKPGTYRVGQHTIVVDDEGEMLLRVDGNAHAEVRIKKDKLAQDHREWVATFYTIVAPGSPNEKKLYDWRVQPKHYRTKPSAVKAALAYLRPAWPNPSEPPKITMEQARDVGTTLRVNWKTAPFDVEQFRQGMTVELEHGDRNDITNVSDDNLIITGMITLAHLLEFPDYYYRLADMEAQADRDKKRPKQKARVMMKSKAYHDKPGYLIYGTTVDGGAFSVFEKDKAKAEKIRDEYKAGKPGYAYRVNDLLLGRPAPNPPPVELQIAARKVAPKWKQYGVTSVGTGYALALGESKPQWGLFAWTRDLPKSTANLPKEVDGYPVRVRGLPHALPNPSDKPHWQVMAETRHAREAVLQEIRAGVGDRAEIARRTGLGEFKVALVMRQLEREGEIEYEENPVADKYKIRKLGEIGGWPVFSVNGGEVRNTHQDFVCGGNHGRYVWIPQPELWVEQTVGAKPMDTVANAYHEAVEYRRMLKGVSYDDAHEHADRMEKKLRKVFQNQLGLTMEQAFALADYRFRASH